MRSRAAMAGAVMAATFALAGCFYDSRWLAQRQAQQAAAKHATPKSLQATDDGERGGPVQTMRIHAYATPRYAAEVVGWKRQIEALVDDANRLLVGTVRVQLEVDAADIWDGAGDDQSLSDALDRLRSLDAGGDADWVVGLVGSVPRAEASFHEIGLSYNPGKHIVMRAMADAAEMDAILKNLKGVSEEDKNKLYSSRKKHKLTTVFLHEIAHSLGVIHERDAASLMSPRYSIEAERFSPEATEWMKAGLRAKTGTEAGAQAAMEDAVLEILKRTPDNWIAAERDARMRGLLASVARRGGAAASATPTGASPPNATSAPTTPAPASAAASTGTGKGTSGAAGDGGTAAGAEGLSADDQALFAKADTHEKAKRYADAMKAAAPLFAKYPNHLSVQDMRCRLAMQVHADDWDKAMAECLPFARLTNGKK